MKFDDLKEMCKEHDKVLEKTKVIQSSNKERHWMKVTTPGDGEFYLGDEEIKILSAHYEKKGLEIENTIHNILIKEGEEG